jgi:predicted MFS family arabinose efflux permease
MIAAGAGPVGVRPGGVAAVLTWDVLIGLGTGSMALVFAATVANAWFVRRRGLVMGILTAGGAAGQLGSCRWWRSRIDPRTLLLVYYTFRGVGLVLLPWLLADSVEPSMIIFIVVYGLDWVATVPPTVALCRRIFGARGTIVFGWVFASHQLGAAAAALGAGIVREAFGTYTYAWFGGAALCAVAALLSVSLRRQPPDRPVVTDRDPSTVAESAADLTP